MTTSDRKWITLVAMTGSLSMIMLDSTVLGVALPSIQRELHIDGAMQAWSVNGYLVAMASWVALGGRIGDIVGRVWAFRLGMIGFMLASIGCALAPTGLLFVMARIVQGICAGTMQPASAAIVVDLYPPERRGRAMAAYAGISLLFLAGGPIVGGALVGWASWHWCFWLNVPIAIVSLGLTAKLVLSNSRGAPRPIDWTSIAMLLIGMPLLISGLQENWRIGDLALGTWSAVVGALIVALFIRRQLGSEHPTIDYWLLRNKAIAADAVVLFCMQFINVGQGIYGSLYFQTVLGFSPLNAGVATLPLLVPVLVVVHYAGRMYDRTGPRTPLVLGLTLVLIGSVIETFGFVGHHYPTIAVGMAVLGCGCGFAMSPANADALSRVTPAQRGEVSGIVQSMRHFGSTLGVAMQVSLIMWLSSASTENSVAPSGLAPSFVLHSAVAAIALVVALTFTPAERAVHA